MSRQLMSGLSAAVISSFLLVYGAVANRELKTESVLASSDSPPPAAAKPRPARNRTPQAGGR